MGVDDIEIEVKDASNADEEECAAMVHAQDASPGRESTGDIEQPATPTDEAALSVPLVHAPSAKSVPQSAPQAVLAGRSVQRPPWRFLTTIVVQATGFFTLGAVVLGLAGSPRGSDSAPTRTKMSAHDVATLLGAYASDTQPLSAAQFNDMQAEVGRVVRDMSASDVATTLDAYARMQRRPHHQLMTALSDRAREVVGQMSAQDVTNVVSAYAELGERIDPESHVR